jgi:diaminohydroxyphosphoribosylaminopyrimidine deaminase/5-amino-6-(5-phosphoribosylamino)uracil reductase
MDDRFLELALDLADAADERAYPKPTVGAVVVAPNGDVVGQGATEPGRAGRHGERVALDEAGERAAGGTLFVTMEPCAHQGSTTPCTEAVLEVGIARVVAGQLDPNPRVEGGGLEKLRAAGVEVELAEGDLGFRARRGLEAWRTWIAKGRPFVTYKVAVTLDGRTTIPGSRWVSGEESRRLVHELRAAADAVAVGMVLLEGGPTLAAAFLEHDLVDRILVFQAPRLSGEGEGMVVGLPSPLELTRLEAQPVGEDVLLSAYVHEP